MFDSFDSRITRLFVRLPRLYVEPSTISTWFPGLQPKQTSLLPSLSPLGGVKQHHSLHILTMAPNQAGAASLGMASENFGYSRVRLRRVKKLQFGVVNPHELVRCGMND